MRLFLILIISSPFVGVAAALLWLILFGCFAGFGHVWPAEFVELRHYLPFILTVISSTLLGYFPLFLIYSKSKASKSSFRSYAIIGALASLLPAAVLSLDDDGNLLNAFRRIDKFKREFFELR